MTDHWWWRPGWQVGTRFYAWHITLDGQEQLHRLADEYQRSLAGIPTLDPIPAPWRHITLHGIGHRDHVSARHLDEIVEVTRVRLAQLPPLRLQFRRAAVFKEAIALPPDKPEAVATLRDELRAGMGDIWGPDGIPEKADGFRAHTSIAYSNSNADSTPIRKALDDAVVQSADATFTHASLILMHRDKRMYEWEELAIAPIGSGAGENRSG